MNRAAGPASATDDAHVRRCRNCGAMAPLRFCPNCGQTTTLHPPTVREFAHEFVTHSIALEGALWKTMVALLLHPGRLTADYFAGRRASYIAPLRLYLTFSLLFFAISGTAGGDIMFANQDFKFSTMPQKNGDVVVAPLHSTFRTGIDSIDRALERGRAMTPEETTARLRAGIRAYLPYVLIVMVPVLALLFKLVYWKRHRLYGEHLVVAFHAQTAAFIFGLVSAIPLGEFYGLFVFLLFLAQGAFAMRRVYGGRMWLTAVRELGIVAIYGIAMLLAVSTLAILSIFLS